MVKVLMMSAEKATPGLLKIQGLCDVIIFVLDYVTQIIL